MYRLTPPPPPPSAGVVYAEPVYIRETLSTPLTPNDYLLGRDWWAATMDASHAWAVTTGSEGVKICFIDTGAKTGHEDLGNRAWGWAGWW